MEESDPPPPPPSKGCFKGRRVRGRSLSYKQKRDSNNQKKRKAQPPEDVAADATASAPAPAASIESFPQDSTIFKKTSKKEYADLLASCECELNAALSEIKKKDNIIEKLNLKINRLTQANQLAMGKAREAKQYAKTVEQDSKKTTRQLKVEMAAAEQKLAQSQRRSLSGGKSWILVFLRRLQVPWIRLRCV
jgi:hypothetical protein